MKRPEIVAEARTWVDTKWKHQASLKGVACDCVGLIRGVYEKLVEPLHETFDYPATWHLFQDEERLYYECQRFLQEIPLEQAGEGDLLVFRIRPRFRMSHIGIKTAEGTFIHSYMDVGRVVETRLNATWLHLIAATFRYPGVED